MPGRFKPNPDPCAPPWEREARPDPTGQGTCCPYCRTPMKANGFTGTGHGLYTCSRCRKRWQIRED